jgi:hypothetical protein
VNLAPGSYQISFLAAQRFGNQQYFGVLVDGNTVGIYQPAGSSYQLFTSTFTIYTTGAHPVEFIGLNSSGDNTALIDNVSITAAPAPQLINAGFELPYESTYAQDPTGAGWSFSGTSGIAANGSVYTSSNPNTPEARQVAYLEQTGSFSESVTLGAGAYQLSFETAQRGNVNPAQQDFNVLVDGVPVGHFTPAGTSYELDTATFIVPAGQPSAHTVQFVGLDTAGGDNTALIDYVTLAPATVPEPANSGFEAPSEGSGFALNPTGGSWTFTGTAGVSGNGSTYTSSNPTAPQGSQVAILEQTGAISQSVPGWTAGTYQITFLAAQRSGNSHPQNFNVLVDGVVVDTFQPPGTVYQLRTTPVFTVGAGTHLITFQGVNSGGGDNTAFLDAVEIAVAATNEPANAGFETPSVGSTYSQNPASAAWTFVGTSGISGNGSTYTSSNPNAPQGTQVAVLEQTGSFYQTLTLAAGSYQIGFQAAQRGNVNAHPQNFQVLVDGVGVGTFTPSGSTYQAFTTSVFAVAAGTHTIKFLGLDSAGGDNTALIDAINVVVSAQPIQALQPADPGFETPSVSNTVVADPSGSGWTFSGTAGIAGNGSSFNPLAPQGNQVAYVEKSSSSFTQTITLVPGCFQISFLAAQRSGNSQFFAVVLDSTTIGIYTPAGSAYQLFTSLFTSYSSGAHTLQFVGENTVGDNVAFIDAVTITQVTAPQLQNASFEIPYVAPGSSVADPSGAGWTFTGTSGIAAISSSYTSGANPPDGGQVAYLEQTGSFNQSLGLPAGSYQIGFQSAQRSTVNTHPQNFNVLVDGNVVGSFTPGGTTYQQSYTCVFTVTGGSHTIAFQGVNSAGGDNTALIDSVFIAQPPPTSAEDTVTNRPITFTTYDNLDEVTSVAQYDGDGVPISATDAPGSNLLRADVVTSYDDQGRVYKTQQYDVNQTNGALSTSALTDNLYYDGRGDQIAEYAPGGLVTKDQYDGAGRLLVESQTDGSGGTTYAAASGLTGDNVLSQTLTTYDNNDNPILVVTKERFHNETGTGALGDINTTPKARVYSVANYYDAADRLTASVNVGTSGGSAYTRPSSPPTPSDTALVTSFAYTYGLTSQGGLTEDATDPRGVDKRTVYDPLDRAIQTVVDYTNGTPTTSTNQTTNRTYDGMDNVVSVTAVMPSGTPSQTTGYVYGVSPASGNGTIYSNDILATLENPDPTTGNASTSLTNQENYQYNTQGDLSAFTDPNGTHTSTATTGSTAPQAIPWQPWDPA